MASCCENHETSSSRLQGLLVIFQPLLEDSETGSQYARRKVYMSSRKNEKRGGRGACLGEEMVYLGAAHPISPDPFPCPSFA
jgi:hypothetical protein